MIVNSLPYILDILTHIHCSETVLSWNNNLKLKQEFQILHILANIFYVCFITVILKGWIKELNLRLETKPFQRKHREIFHAIGLGKDFIEYSKYSRFRLFPYFSNFQEASPTMNYSNMNFSAPYIK